jgi:hypothetical protein
MGRGSPEFRVEKLGTHRAIEGNGANKLTGLGTAPPPARGKGELKRKAMKETSSHLTGRSMTSVQAARGRALFAEGQLKLVMSEGLVDVALSISPIWEGDVVLPAFDVSARYRFVIVEYEEYLADDSRPFDPVPTKKDRRIGFVEHVELT